MKTIFIGYCVESKAYRLYEPIKGVVIVSHNVTFNEDSEWDWRSSEQKGQSKIPVDFMEELIPASSSHTSSSPPTHVPLPTAQSIR